MDDRFRDYLRDVFKGALYGLGEELYENRKELAVGPGALQSKKAYLKELNQLADELSKTAVAELEASRVGSAEDLLAKEGLVREKMRSVQSQMEKQLGSK